MQTGNLDGQGLAELRGYKFPNLSSAPTTNVYEGRFYMNTSDHTLYVYNGSAWVDALSQGRVYLAGLGIDATALANGTIAVSTTIASKTDIGSANLIIQENSVAKGTFSANATSPVTVNISVPTTATEVGALPDTTTIGAANTTIKANNTAIGTINANATTASSINISIPTTATEVGALPASTTIADLVTSTQLDAINSGITAANVTAIATNTSGIAEINSLIPSATSTSNQLADKAFVNSSVQTATANFRGNWATWSAVPTDSNDYPVDYAGSKVPTVNDYLVVQDASGYTGETLEGTWRFKYTGDWATDGKSGWLPEYQVNETPMTAAQLAALNSGITAAGVTQIATNTSAIATKQDILTAGSNITINGNTISATNTVYTLPIASTSTLGGIKVGNNLTIASDGTLAAVAEQMTVDTTLSTSSTNPVQNKVVTSAIQSNTSAIAAKSSVTFVDWTV